MAKSTPVSDIQDLLRDSIMKEMRDTAGKCGLHVFEIPIAIYVDISSRWSSRWCFEEAMDTLEDVSVNESEEVRRSEVGKGKTELVTPDQETPFSTNTCKVRRKGREREMIG